MEQSDRRGGSTVAAVVGATVGLLGAFQVSPAGEQVPELECGVGISALIRRSQALLGILHSRRLYPQAGRARQA
jgi:hypothetical protein